MSSDTKRLKKYYHKHFKGSKTWSLTKPYVLFLKQTYERTFLNFLSRRFVDFSSITVLDVGCGTGGLLGDLLRYGFDPTCLFGIDLLDFRIEEAKQKYGNINFKVVDAEKIPFPNNHFDLVLQNVVFSSILDNNKQRQIANEMLRVTKADGCIIWYDASSKRLNSDNFKAINKNEIKKLFPNCKYYFKKINLHFLLLGYALKLSWTFAQLLYSIPIFRTHYFTIIIPEK